MGDTQGVGPLVLLPPILHPFKAVPPAASVRGTELFDVAGPLVVHFHLCAA